MMPFAFSNLLVFIFTSKKIENSSSPADFAVIYIDEKAKGLPLTTSLIPLLKMEFHYSPSCRFLKERRVLMVVLLLTDEY